MEIALQHAITYTTRGDVPVPIVAKSLLANERLIREALRVLEASSPNLAISNVRIKVSHLSNASPLKTILAVAVMTAFQEDLAREVPALLEQLTGLQVPSSLNTVVTVLVMVVALYVIAGAAEKILGVNKLEKVKRDYEDKKERLSELAGVDKERLEQYLMATIPDGRQTSLLNKAIDFLLPAKLESGVDVVGPDEVRMASEVIAEIPIDLATDKPETSYQLDGVVIEIHRADRDQNKHGWRAVIQSISGRKVRMELAPGLTPADLYGKTAIIGDVTVVEERSEDGDYVPKTYHLLNVRGAAGEN